MARGWGNISEYYDDPEPDPVNDILFGRPGQVDEYAQYFFREAMFERDRQAYDDLVIYLHDVYGIEFEDTYEWTDFRVWYEGSRA